MAAVRKKVEVSGTRTTGKRAVSGKPTGKKTGNRKASVTTGRKTSPRARRTVEQVMAYFEDARPSDVSDKVFVATSPVHGKGLFAATRLKAGTLISRLHGMPTFDDGTYVLWITDELGLELTNDLKYINHDKNPNAAYSDLDVTLLRDVEAGEELLHDYGW
ncbi:SET domain-containing protein [Granulosicoccus sp. 3-233]|uniref:SET domain-containing protein n=1 Tax=Granulosicoccus sp. 3-233 TaxID=3417969 RepID=UPI003D3538E7